MKINPDVDSMVVFKEYPQSEEYKNYRRMWDEYPQKHIVSDYPIHLDIEITRSCNLRCPFCYREYIQEKTGMMSLSNYKKILDQGTPQSLKLNWLGEPLLHPDIVEMVKYAKNKGVLDVMFNTNGVLLTPKLSQELVDAGLDKIILSIDSIVAEQYEKYRPPAKYDTVIKNVKELIKIKKDKIPIVRVSKVSLSATQYEEAEDFWRELGIDEFMVTRCIDNNPDLKMGNPTCCPEIWQRLLIDYIGRVLPCCSMYRYQCVLGDTFKESIKSIWHGETLNRMREIHEQEKAYTLSCCEGCEVTGEY